MNPIYLTSQLQTKPVLETIWTYGGLSTIIALLSSTKTHPGFTIYLRMDGIVNDRGKRYADHSFIDVQIVVRGDESAIYVQGRHENGGKLHYDTSYTVEQKQSFDSQITEWDYQTLDLHWLDSRNSICWNDRYQMEYAIEVDSQNYTFSNVQVLVNLIKVLTKLRKYSSTPWIYQNDDQFYQNLHLH